MSLIPLPTRARGPYWHPPRNLLDGGVEERGVEEEVGGGPVTKIKGGVSSVWLVLAGSGQDVVSSKNFGMLNSRE